MELLVVIVVIGILSGVVVFAMGGVGDQNRTAACTTDAKAMKVAVTTYKSRFGALPVDQGALVSAQLIPAPSQLHGYAVNGSTYTLTPIGDCAVFNTTTSSTTPVPSTTTTTPPIEISGSGDMFVDAIAIPRIGSGGSVIAHSTLANMTTEVHEPWFGLNQYYSSIWYAYTPSATRSIKVTANGMATGSTWIAIYQGNVITGLSTIQQMQSTLAGFSAVSGNTYRIQVVSAVGAGKAGTVTFSDHAASGDTFTDALPVAQVGNGGSIATALDMTATSTQPSEPWFGLNQYYATSWFSYTPSATRSVRVTVAGVTDGSTWIGVYQGSTLGSLTTLQQVQSTKAGFSGINGSTYRIQVAIAVGTGKAGTVTFSDHSASGDTFTDAIAVAQVPSGGSVVKSVDMSETSTQPAEPWFGVNQYYATSWFSYTPTSVRSVKVTAAGVTDTSTWIGVYQGTALGSLATIQQVQSTVAGFAGVPGTTYWVQVAAEVGHGKAGTVTFADNAPNGDAFEDAISVAHVGSGASIAKSINMLAMSTETNEPWTGLNQYYGSSWFSYTPTTTRSVLVTASGVSDTSVWIAVYQGSTITALTTIQQASSTYAGFAGIAGSTYRIQVLTVVGHGTSGTVTFSDNAANGDAFADAIPVAQVAAGGSIAKTVDESKTSTEPNEPWSGLNQYYGSSWFSYSPTTTRSVLVTVSGVTSGSTYIGMYEGSTLTSLTPIQQDTNTHAGFAGVAGHTYRIHVLVATGTGASGTVTFSDNSANGDAFADAIPISQIAAGGSVTKSIDSTAVSTEPGDPWTGNSQWYATSWFTYTPTTTRSVRVVASPSLNDSQLWMGVYTGSSLTSLTMLQQNMTNSIAFAGVAGTTYKIQVIMLVYHGSTGTVTFSDNSGNADNFSEARSVAAMSTGTNRTTSINALAVSQEPGEPWIGSVTWGGSNWISYTPSVTQTITVTATGMNSSWTQIGAYRGSVLGSLTVLGQVNANSMSFTAQAGSTYRIQVVTAPGYGTTSGTVTLAAS